jgi:hypothetical protein
MGPCRDRHCRPHERHSGGANSEQNGKELSAGPSLAASGQCPVFGLGALFYDIVKRWLVVAHQAIGSPGPFTRAPLDRACSIKIEQWRERGGVPGRSQIDWGASDHAGFSKR